MTGDSEATRVTRLGRDRFGTLLPSITRRFTPIRARAALHGAWLWPLLATVLAFAIRMWRIDEPNHIIFDETYYAKDAYSLLQYGYVREFTDKADAQIVEGHLDGIFRSEPTEIVHPDGGKW
ncbi:MAG: phospholipid carrier-dependent glycosyltransferase, partial [Nocardioidaceae bacterium]